LEQNEKREERRETVENGEEIHCRREIGENEKERKGDRGEWRKREQGDKGRIRKREKGDIWRLVKREK
jgi:hypothetical protein